MSTIRTKKGVKLELQFISQFRFKKCRDARLVRPMLMLDNHRVVGRTSRASLQYEVLKHPQCKAGNYYIAMYCISA